MKELKTDKNKIEIINGCLYKLNNGVAEHVLCGRGGSINKDNQIDYELYFPTKGIIFNVTDGVNNWRSKPIDEITNRKDGLLGSMTIEFRTRGMLSYEWVFNP